MTCFVQHLGQLLDRGVLEQRSQRQFALQTCLDTRDHLRQEIYSLNEKTQLTEASIQMNQVLGLQYLARI